jgi:serine/threonine protein kinase
MAPEVISGPSYDTPADVYSFGMLIWACWTWDIPYANIPNNEKVLKHVAAGGSRPGRPAFPRCSDDLWALIQKCWDKTPATRPTFPAIVVRPAHYFVDVVQCFGTGMCHAQHVQDLCLAMW